MDEVEWTYIGPDGRINGIISAPNGRFPIKSIEDTTSSAFM